MNKINLQDNENTNSNSLCAACGNAFGCGAESGFCWCFTVRIAKEQLAELESRFDGCLCQTCLQKYSEVSSK